MSRASHKTILMMTAAFAAIAAAPAFAQDVEAVVITGQRIGAGSTRATAVITAEDIVLDIGACEGAFSLGRRDFHQIRCRRLGPSHSKVRAEITPPL